MAATKGRGKVVGFHVGAARPPPTQEEYRKLIRRFFEPLNLLSALGPTRGPLTNPDLRADGSPQFARRQFLDDLAYLCDYKRGGDSVTAIAIQDLPDRFVLWIACNAPCESKILGFVRTTLDYVREIRNLPSNERQAEIVGFTSWCIESANPRIKEVVKFLQNDIMACRASLQASRSRQGLVPTAECAACQFEYGAFADFLSVLDVNLLHWLNRFQGQRKDHMKICSLAYAQRHAPEMTELARWDQSRPHFGSARHHIGRLAHHIRAGLRLIENAESLSQLLESDLEVRYVSMLPAVDRPEPEEGLVQTGDPECGLEALDNILNRMLQYGRDDPRFPRYQEGLHELDRRYLLRKIIREQYDEGKKFEPRVHCEIQILDHFFKNGFIYAFNDKYIACSKRACYCCRLYIRYHPARVVEPGCHQNIYLKWSPPNLSSGWIAAAAEATGRSAEMTSEDFYLQRYILGKMVAEIRGDALEQILAKGEKLASHPDSSTGITSLEVIRKKMASWGFGRKPGSSQLSKFTSSDPTGSSTSGGDTVSSPGSSEFSGESSDSTSRFSSVRKTQPLRAVSIPGLWIAQIAGPASRVV